MATKVKPAQWAYKGLDSSGKKTKGVLEAPSEAHAVQQLKARGVVPDTLSRKGGGTGLQQEITIPGLERAPSLKDLALLTRQLATMVNAGVSILRALTIVTSQTDNAKLRRTLEETASKVEGGTALSVALEEFPRVIPPIMVHLIRAGETGGFLDRSLLMVADNFEAETKLRSKVKAALTYPVVVLIIALVAVAAMLIFIVPVFDAMFRDLGSELPAVTQLLVNMSNAMPVAVPIIVVVAVAFSIWWGMNKNTEAVRRVVDPMKLKVPVFGQLNTKIALTRFTRNFSTMLASGVPILQSLAIVGATSGNYVVTSSLQGVQEGVRQGRPIAESLAEVEIFPEMLIQMVGIGEESGAIDTMLEKTADFYDDEVETMSSQLTAMLEPLMIVFMGALLGFMILALYMPMFMVFQAI
ncbi:type II secretion system F family protein [Microbacterium sp. zg.Y1090]|uniref:type II secretion system F family protein n=1 Tax=Microbacterium TaxID=33882 RepID=UPI00214AC5F0|nr:MULTISPECIES: type II secretion system F family protein [unclassified Microbacterium]MCR2814142.1 type II secretion system F family protein [Microbacterium sp. zg.Y1084]MCR2819898.1 type II secretion system F family protein [Microbacterium sp. zg.Y1090]MDL5488010.1 type II secretion system F family protein [Microbacterium sp. zg-Y1211]WIM27486.1 type II secretion system F family protein [Microbacterium sp. zg-Y1090]